MFRRVLTDLSKGVVLKPLLHSYLYDARFPKRFTLTFEDEGRREPDGWFHPSTHPLWPERMLYWYLVEPTRLVHDPMGYMGTLSVTVGKAMHGFIEMCLTEQGVRLSPDEMEAEGITVGEDGEPFVMDSDVGSRGHMDGVLRLEIPTHLDLSRQVFDYKTTNDRKIAKVDDLDLDAFREIWPQYYAQQQEYMRMSGYGMSVVLFMALGFPWEMREFHIPYDPHFALGVRDKYLRVREAASGAAMPQPCCAPFSKDAEACPARTVCPVGLAESRGTT